MAKRIAKLERNTNETQIKVELNLDGTGEYSVDTGVGFFDHMLAHVAKHGLERDRQAAPHQGGD